MTDNFKWGGDTSAPASRAFAITPHDSNALIEVTRAIFVGTGGNITLRAFDGGADVVLRNVASGTIIPLRTEHVRAAGTTAADLVGFA